MATSLLKAILSSSTYKCSVVCKILKFLGLSFLVCSISHVLFFLMSCTRVPFVILYDGYLATTRGSNKGDLMSGALELFMVICVGYCTMNIAIVLSLMRHKG